MKPLLLATALAATIAAAPALAQSADLDSLVGFQARLAVDVAQTAQSPAGTLTATTTVRAATSKTLQLRYVTVMLNTDHALFRRITSDVTIPLRAVQLSTSYGGVRFTCADGTNCISWTHLDFYSADGADFGKAGSTATYGVALSAEDAGRLTATLCPATTCQ